MVRSSITEELKHLEEIAVNLGELMIEGQTLPRTIRSISSWKRKLDSVVLSTDQLDLHHMLLTNTNALGALTNETCEDYLKHYIELIEQMRQRLYTLKTMNRSTRSNLKEIVIGDYKLLPGGRIFLRDSEITFGGKLRAILVAFLVGNDEHVLTAAEIARIWGDDNIATVSKHKCKLDKALARYYGDRHKHIKRVRTSPTTYQLEIG